MIDEARAHLKRGPLLGHHFHPHGGLNRHVAMGITVGFGSMWAFWVLVGWQLGWIAWQSSGHFLIVRDPYPFTFCLFLSNLIQLWALPAIMVGQNVLQGQADARAEAGHAILASLHEMQVTQTEILHRLDLGRGAGIAQGPPANATVAQPPPPPPGPGC